MTHSHIWTEARSQADAVLGYSCQCGAIESVEQRAAAEAKLAAADARRERMAEPVHIDCKSCGLTVAVPRSQAERGVCCDACRRRRGRRGYCAACANGGEAPMCSEKLRDGEPCMSAASQIVRGWPVCGRHLPR